jgi:hypothetical protein
MCFHIKMWSRNIFFKCQSLEVKKIKLKFNFTISTRWHWRHCWSFWNWIQKRDVCKICLFCFLSIWQNLNRGDVVVKCKFSQMIFFQIKRQLNSLPSVCWNTIKEIGSRICPKIWMWEELKFDRLKISILTRRGHCNNSEMIVSTIVTLDKEFQMFWIILFLYRWSNVRAEG